jgi:diguanylate cyclase (GGDEF)-like protein
VLKSAVVVGAGAAVTAALPGSRLAQLVYLGCFAGIVLVAWQAVRHSAPADRLPWVLVAGAMTSWLVGDVISAVQELVGYQPPVGVPDVLWLGGYPLLGAGLVSMVRRRAPHQGRAAALDGLTLTTAAALGLWQLVVAPAVAESDVDLTVVVQVLYPLGDVVLLASVLYLVLSPGTRGTPTRLLVGGMILTLGCDLGFSLLPEIWSGAVVTRLDGLLLVANALLVAGVRHPGRAELLTPVRLPVASLHPARVLFLGLAVLTAPLMAIMHGGMSVAERTLLLLATVTTVGFSLARFTGAVREQARIQQLLAHQAAHDVLTGLANRRTLIQRLEHEFQPGVDTVLLYVDLDGFKVINDTMGHAAGDAVLIEVARRFQQTVRVSDIVARLGGDEFAVLCHRLDVDEAQRLADRLAEAVAVPIPYEDAMLSVTASIGLATARQCSTGDELINQADDAMFAVKRQRGPSERLGVSA